MFYLAHSTHFIYGYMVLDMVKVHSDKQLGNLPPLFQIAARVLLYAISHRQDSTYHIPVVEL